ncbi:MAG: hypothetical protein JWR07_5520 [Nevskia sp.]|nr:hypothetical protein [Nevskia sp.]
MKFSIYGRFQLEVEREDDAWAVYRLSIGLRVKAHDIVIPAEVEATELAVFLDDLFHELAQPGENIEQL